MSISLCKTLKKKEWFEEEATMVVAPEHTLRDLVAPGLTQQLLYITYPKTMGNFELKLA